MLFNMETFKIIRKPCSSNRKLCKESIKNWKSPVKIMQLNVSTLLGINNLSNCCSSRKHGLSIWISLIICVLILVSFADAYPAASAMSRSYRDNTRQYVLSPNLGGNSAAQRSFGGDDSSSGDATFSLSIFSPLDILRQNMLLEIQRKRIRHAKQRQINSNKEFLDRIGR